jgi:hypothetical protein
MVLAAHRIFHEFELHIECLTMSRLFFVCMYAVIAWWSNSDDHTVVTSLIGTFSDFLNWFSPTLIDT